MKKIYIRPITKNALTEIGFICQAATPKVGSPAINGNTNDGSGNFPWQGSDDDPTIPADIPERPNEYGIEPMSLW